MTGDPGVAKSPYHSDPLNPGVEYGRWYTKAAEQGFVAAQYNNVGQAYNLGRGVDKDSAEAARWWQKAAEQGLAKAQNNLGLAYHSGDGVKQDDVEAYFWLNLH